MERDLRADKKNKWFAGRTWYAAALGVIVWSVFQEIIMASTDIVDSLFVNKLENWQIDGFDSFVKMIKESGFDLVDSSILEGMGLGSYAGGKLIYTPGQIAVNGISASNQMYIIMFCMVSGFCYGTGIYSSQYYGSKNYDKLKQVGAMKMIVVFIITSIFAIMALPGLADKMVGFTTAPKAGIQNPGFVLSKDASVEQVQQWFDYIQNEAAKLSTQEGTHYYQIIAPTYILLTINQTAITSLRETRRPIYSFLMAVIALSFNCVGNFILTDPSVLGHNALGVRGSATATAVARAIQTIFIVSLLAIKKFEFIPRWESFKIQKRIVMNTSSKAMPILLNELLFAFGGVLMVKMRGMYSVEALTANAIYATITMGIFSPLYHGVNAGITAFVGNELGGNNLKKAEFNARHLYLMSIIGGVVFGMLLVGFSGLIPSIWDVNPEAKRIASKMLFFYGFIYIAIMMTNSAYSIQRAGGRVWEATLMDSVFNWVVQLPLYALLILFNTKVNPTTGFIILDITWIFLIVQSTAFIQGLFGYTLYRRKKWLVNLTTETDEKPELIIVKFLRLIRNGKHAKLNPNMSVPEENTVERIDELILHAKENLWEAVHAPISDERTQQIKNLNEVIKTLEENRIQASEGFRAHKIGRIRKKP